MKKGFLSVLFLLSLSVLLFFLVFIFSGCSKQATIPEQFNIEFMNVSHTDIFLSEENKTRDKLEFIMFNKEEFDLSCEIVIKIDNETNSLIKKGKVGLIEAGRKKNVSMSFEMLEGKSRLVVERSCDKG
jgi:hypothetical protein